ncbi:MULTISPECIES: AAA family ATPase [Nostocales]|uniref:AAA family ATPase n=3 Tax=Nostocales TaxID=1161 RepID=A0A0C1NDP6_9CYAN|nr:AAA family ATPase [Tolypothrix bouteillei]KAF3888168.1 AAA family ATPase [Tolypothrix bouteillei VB521301]
MPNLESVTIHQFRGLRDLNLDNLGRINLLVGINNSGKTSVLEALAIYCHPLDIRVWISTARQREQESRIQRTSPLDALQWLFTRNSASDGEGKESTIHTELLQNSFRWLVKWCKEMDIQLFATTHSLEAVDALLQVTEVESEQNLVLYRLEPKESKTKVIRHDWNRLRRLREDLGQEVRW